MMEVTFTEDTIEFARYEFPGASVYPAGSVAAARVRDVDPDAAPPEIRTMSGETLFVGASHQRELARFGARTGIATVRRPDIWADLLEPFLDTEFTPDDERRTVERLHAATLSDDEIATIRDRVGPVVFAYNCVAWEWVHLGLFDLLNAVNGPVVPTPLRESLGDPGALYRWAMEIAERRRGIMLRPGVLPWARGRRP